VTAPGAITVSGFPPQRSIDYPPDVVDTDALRRRLAETDLFGSAQAEAAGYLDNALERFRVTMAMVPSLPAGAKVLELGSNPYFLTRLLRERGLDVCSANWFGEASAFGQHGSQAVVESGALHVYEFDHFNIEAASFPYEESTFDLVLFCEILEHLPCNPTHTLVEIHRILRPGGRLILTTPNASRLENLVKVLRGDNMYESLSGYGVYGRHNREYTIPELSDFLEGCGFAINDIFAQDIWFVPELPAELSGINVENRGENLFAIAEPRPTASWYYPAWLYQSIHAYRRAVRPDLVVGVNCDLQAWGVHELESFGDCPGRWTDGAAETGVLVAAPFNGRSELRIRGRSPDIGGSMTVTAQMDEHEFAWPITCDGTSFALRADMDLGAGEHKVLLSTDRPWCPRDHHSPDQRTLGFILQSVSLEPCHDTGVRPQVIVGINCETQLTGAHNVEVFDGHTLRWTDGTDRTTALLSVEDGGPVCLAIVGRTPQLGGVVEIRAEMGGKHLSWSLPADGESFYVTADVDASAGTTEVVLSTDRPFRPCDERASTDGRTLGFLIESVTLGMPPDWSPEPGTASSRIPAGIMSSLFRPRRGSRR
jgi:SAM-dependent methyltransferase